MYKYYFRNPQKILNLKPLKKTLVYENDPRGEGGLHIGI